MERNVTVKEAVDLYNESKNAYNIAEEISNVIFGKLGGLKSHQVITVTQILKLYISDIESITYSNQRKINDSIRSKGYKK